MQEPELLQKQRQNLRLFRQAAANRELAEKVLADNHAFEKTQADDIQNNAQNKADNLHEKAHHAYISAQDEFKLRKLAAVLPLQTKVQAKPLPQHPNNDPEVELDHAVSLTTSLSLRIRSNLAKLGIWEAQRQRQKQFLVAVALVIVALVLYLLFEAWGKTRQYDSAISALEAGEWEEARRLFTELGDYQDSHTLLKETYYHSAKVALEEGEWEEARRLFAELGDYQDSQILLKETYYQSAKTAVETGNWDAALSLTGNSPQELLSLGCPPPSEPSLGDTWERCSDGMAMVYVPRGSFMMGTGSFIMNTVDENLNERPVHEVTLTNFWLDKTEVTNKMYGQCVAAGRCRISSYVTDNKFNGENQPVVGVSWDNANAYCEWVGGKLPTEAQWEYSAKGPDGNRFPWGNTPPNKTLANFDENVGKTTDVGSYPAGASWVGALNMAGNAVEWVADWYSSTYYASAPSDNPPGPESGTAKVVRGGSWDDLWSNLRAAYRYKYYPSLENSTFGFRCVSAPGK